MKATINGIPVEGTPVEIAELMRLQGAQAAPAPIPQTTGPAGIQVRPWSSVEPPRWQRTPTLCQTVCNPDPCIVTFS